MANEFHRLTPPPTGGAYVRAAWSGVIPEVGVFDWMNNDPAAPLAQAPADGPVINPGNPYFGSHFVAGKEDAADIYANRAHRALSENVDMLDTMVHRAIPFANATVWNVAAPTDTFTFAATEPVYMGGADAFIRILRASDFSQVMDSVGNAIHVLSNSSDPLDAANFGTNTVVQFTEALPVGQYYVAYGSKNCVAEVPELLSAGLHGYTEISAKVERLLQMLHAPIGGPIAEFWDSPWDSTVYDLTLSGLNERYRRAKTSDWVVGLSSDYATVGLVDWGWPGTNQWDAPGSGAWILRRGMAPTVVSKRKTATPLETDKLNACWRAVLADDANTHGGSVGVAVQGAHPMFDDGHQYGPGLASHLIHKPARMTNTGWYATSAVTTIPDGGAIGLQYEADPVTAVIELTCELQETNAHFYKLVGGIKTSAISTGIDMLEVLHEDGDSKFWMIHRMWSTTKCSLRSLNGDVAPVGRVNGGYDGAPTITNATATWHTVVNQTGDGAAEMQLIKAQHNNQYWPGYLPIPSPIGYGTLFMAALPWLGVVSNQSLNQFQQFDQGVVGIFGSVVGNPVAGASPTPGVYPMPHPDLALQIGCKQPLADAFGQTPLVPLFSFLSNGIAYMPRLNVAELDCYNKQAALELITVNTNMSLNAGYALNADMVTATSLVAQFGSTDGVKIYPLFGNLNRYLQFETSGQHFRLSHDNTTYPFTNVIFDNATKALYMIGGSGYEFRRTLDRGGGTVTVSMNAADVDVDIYPNGSSLIYVQSQTVSPATLHVKIHPLTDETNYRGSVFTYLFYINNALAGSGTINVVFESGDPAVHVGTTATFAHTWDGLTHEYDASYFDLYYGVDYGTGLRNVGVAQKVHFKQV